MKSIEHDMENVKSNIEAKKALLSFLAEIVEADDILDRTLVFDEILAFLQDYKLTPRGIVL